MMENGGMTLMLENLQLLSSGCAKVIHVSKRKFQIVVHITKMSACYMCEIDI